MTAPSTLAPPPVPAGILVDVETTHRDPTKGDLASLAAVRFDFATWEPTGEMYHTLVRPERPEAADPASMRVHGLPMERLLAEGRPAREVVDGFEAAMLRPDERGTPARHVELWAHNSSFERGFLRLLLERAGEDIDRWGYRFPDTYTVIASASRVFALPPVASQLSLDAMVRHYGLPRRAEHDALEDCLLTLAVMRHVRGDLAAALGRRGLDHAMGDSPAGAVDLERRRPVWAAQAARGAAVGSSAAPVADPGTGTRQRSRGPALG